MTEPVTNHVCLRRGYGCKCEHCLPWIRKWSKELDAFSLIDDLIRNGKPLLQIFERLAAEHPDILQLHSQFIEKQYITHHLQQGAFDKILEERECKKILEERERKKIHIKLKKPPPRPQTPPLPPPSP